MKNDDMDMQASPGDLYATLWREYLAAADEFERRIAELKDREINAMVQQGKKMGCRNLDQRARQIGDGPPNHDEPG